MLRAVNASRIFRTSILVGLTALGFGCSAIQRRNNLPVQVALNDANFQRLTNDGDKVSVGEAPRPDGHADIHLTARVQGDIRAFILTLCDDLGHHTGTQWDTIVGQDPIPDGFLNHLGADTWVLGVVGGPENRLLNRSDGFMPETAFAAGSTIQLYAAMREAVQPGHFFCLTALPANGEPVTARTELTGSVESNM
jgi:hypothetical protein